MLFNSIQFLIFFPIILVLFYLIPVRFRWILLLSASIYFYMAWKAEYFFLLLAYILLNYFIALRIDGIEKQSHRKIHLWLSVVFNLGVLFLFKYFGFFRETVQDLSLAAGIEWKLPVLQLVLPMGISFYTFQIMSYVVDVYRRHIPAERHLGIFALFVAFFPQLVAGPIERAGHLISSLRDLRNKLNNEAVISGFQFIVLGFFKKLVIADRISSYVNEVYTYPADYCGLNIAIATFFFSMQIYCDFSGYSDIAIGSARLLGVRLMDNFRSPYFSQSISEFWSRWHISLSTWFRDYLYIPLGGNRVVKWRWYYNLFITFVISGFWHGANWTFIWWGMLHGIYLIAGFLIRDFLARNGVTVAPRSGSLVGFLRILMTYLLVYFAWVFFRAQNLDDAFLVIRKILTLHRDLGQFKLTMTSFGVFSLSVSMLSIAFLLFYEWLMPRRWMMENYIIRISVTIILTCLTLLAGIMGSKSFIYFQF